jgi:hypothetical protein
MNLEYDDENNEKHLKFNTNTASLCILIFSIVVGISFYFGCITRGIRDEL